MGKNENDGGIVVSLCKLERDGGAEEKKAAIVRVRAKMAFTMQKG